MPGGHTPFGTRAFGSHGPVIDPGTLHPALYLSGLPGDGLAQTAGSLTQWTDKVLGAAFQPSTGSSGISVFNSGEGLNPGIWSVSICGGNFFRGFDAHGTLPGFSNANGYTQYVLLGQLGSGAEGVRGYFWNTVSNGPSLIYQGAGFSFFGGVPNGHLALQVGSTGYDTGIVTPQGNQTLYDLWTLVSDGNVNTTVYRNGIVGPTLATGAAGLQTNLNFGGPSTGATFVCSLISSYILYTAQHTPGQIAGVRRWFRQNYGV